MPFSRAMYSSANSEWTVSRISSPRMQRLRHDSTDVNDVSSYRRWNPSEHRAPSHTDLAVLMMSSEVMWYSSTSPRSSHPASFAETYSVISRTSFEGCCTIIS
jgi:hypothetical protein